MTLRIVPEILDQTTKCRFSFACLKGKPEDVCPVDYVTGELSFLKGARRCHCSYQTPFGESLICTCPTRNEIYQCYEM